MTSLATLEGNSSSAEILYSDYSGTFEVTVRIDDIDEGATKAQDTFEITLEEILDLATQSLDVIDGHIRALKKETKKEQAKRKVALAVVAKMGARFTHSKWGVYTAHCGVAVRDFPEGTTVHDDPSLREDVDCPGCIEGHEKDSNWRAAAAEVPA